MGKSLRIQHWDEEIIERLKQRLGFGTKVDVVRAGLKLLEFEVDRKERIARGKAVGARASLESSKVNRDFRAHSRLKRGW